jgi:hypothetical protein
MLELEASIDGGQEADLAQVTQLVGLCMVTC